MFWLFFFLGDVNLDMAVTSEDAWLVYEYTLDLTQLTPLQLGLADVDGNGLVDANDVQGIWLMANLPVGDVDLNGSVTFDDALALFLWTLGLRQLRPYQLWLADADGNGLVDANDIQAIFRSIHR